MYYKVIGIDTNFILSIFIKRNNSNEALDLLSKIIEEYDRIFIPQQVIAEIVYVLEGIYKYTENYKKLSKEKISEYIEAIFNIPKSEIENAEVILEALNIYRKENVSFGDALIVASLINKKIYELASFDKALNSLKNIKVIDSIEKLS